MVSDAVRSPAGPHAHVSDRPAQQGQEGVPRGMEEAAECDRGREDGQEYQDLATHLQAIAAKRQHQDLDIKQP